MAAPNKAKNKNSVSMHRRKDLPTRTYIFILVVVFVGAAVYAGTLRQTAMRPETSRSILLNAALDRFVPRNLRTGNTSSNTETSRVVNSAPTVALMFTPIHELFNEPVWRAFFEAAGELHLRVEPPERPYISYIRGKGETLFKRVSNEQKRCSLRAAATAQSADAIEVEKVLNEETERLLSETYPNKDVITKQSLFTVYTHPTVGYYFPETSIFHATEIPDRLNMTGQWATYRVVQIEIKLLRAALGQKSNEKFVLLSDSCIPLYRPEVIFLQLLSEAKSRVHACDQTSEHSNIWRLDARMETKYLTKANWRKSSQWFGLKRSHAELLIEDTHLGEKFEKHCKPFENSCVSDEHYIATMLAIYELGNETDCIGHMTKTWFRPAPEPHPLSFTPESISIDLFKKMRDVENCAGSEAQASTQNVFQGRRAEFRRLLFDANATRISQSGNTDNWIVKRGYLQLGYDCSVCNTKDRPRPDASSGRIPIVYGSRLAVEARYIRSISSFRVRDVLLSQTPRLHDCSAPEARVISLFSRESRLRPLELH